MQPSRTETLAPPNDATLESAVLGAMMIEAPAVGTALAMLKNNAEVFYTPAHQFVFTAITTLNETGRAVDIIMVVGELQRKGQLQKCGGMAGIAGLTERINSAAHLASHCTALIELYTKRRIAQIGQQFLAKAFSPMNDPLELIAEAQAEINNLHSTMQMRSATSVGSMYDAAMDEIIAASKVEGGITGVPCGLTAVDNVTGGWQPQDLIIIAARPGMGKTSFTLACAINSQNAGKHGALFSLEMGRMQLVKKTIATEAGYSTNQLVRGVDLDTEEAEYLRERAQRLRQSGLLIDDTPAISISELRAKVAKHVAEGVQIIYIDYLQLMTADGKGNREQEIGAISRGLKLIAKENNVPVIALAQLSRNVETRGGDKKPMLSDLRESGSIEQDADVVIFLYRAEYYKVLEDEMGMPTQDTTEVIFAKHRNGGLKSPIVQSYMRTGRYQDMPADAPYTVVSSNGHSSSPFPTSSFDEPPY